MFDFDEDHRNGYPVTLLCRVMQVARSGYYAGQNEPITLRKVPVWCCLLQHIRDIFKEERHTRLARVKVALNSLCTTQVSLVHGHQHLRQPRTV